MRPQRNAAENDAFVDHRRLPVTASMRPQRNAAENGHHRLWTRSIVRASMRPQRNAAENVSRKNMPVGRRVCFNEAAA